MSDRRTEPLAEECRRAFRRHIENVESGKFSGLGHCVTIMGEEYEKLK